MTRRKQGVCVLESCNNEERVYTLCKSCRDTHKIYVYRDLERRRAENRRREAEARKRELAAEEAARVEERRRPAQQREQADAVRTPIPVGVHKNDRPVEAHTIAAIRQALLSKGLRQVATQIGISHTTVRHLAESLPGAPITRRVDTKLKKWMGIE